MGLVLIDPMSPDITTFCNSGIPDAMFHHIQLDLSEHFDLRRFNFFTTAKRSKIPKHLVSGEQTAKLKSNFRGCGSLQFKSDICVSSERL